MAHPWAILMEKPIGLDLERRGRRSRPKPVSKDRGFLSDSTAVFSPALRPCWPISPTTRLRASSTCRTSRASTARQIGHAEAVVRNWMYANSIHLVDYLLRFWSRRRSRCARRSCDGMPENPVSCSPRSHSKAATSVSTKESGTGPGHGPAPSPRRAAAGKCGRWKRRSFRMPVSARSIPSRPVRGMPLSSPAFACRPNR